MSDPTPAPQPPVENVSGPIPGQVAIDKASVPPRRRRWIDGITVILLSVAAAGAVGAAAAPILRAAGLGPPPELVAAHGDREVSPSLAEPRPHGFFAPPEDEDEGPIVTDLERQYPDGMWPGRGGRERAQPTRERDGADPPRPMRAAGNTKLGLTQRPLTLFESPSEGGDVLGAVKAGELVMVMKEVGDWVLVAYNGPTDVLMGWVKKSGIAIR